MPIENDTSTLVKIIRIKCHKIVGAKQRVTQTLRQRIRAKHRPLQIAEQSERKRTFPKQRALVFI